MSTSSDFQRFRHENQQVVSEYLAGLERGDNQHPDDRARVG